MPCSTTRLQICDNRLEQQRKLWVSVLYSLFSTPQERDKKNENKIKPFTVNNYGLAGGSVVKNLSANAGDSRDSGLILGWGRFPGEGNDNPLQYACLENPMNRGAWWARVHGVTKVRHN